MPQTAKVTSIEAIDAFKASLIVYLEKAGCVLDDVSDDVVRTRTWLQTDRQLHWKNQMRQRTRELAQAEQELLTARLSGMPEAIKTRQMAVNKARLALHENDGCGNLRRRWNPARKWSRNSAIRWHTTCARRWPSLKELPRPSLPTSTWHRPLRPPRNRGPLSQTPPLRKARPLDHRFPTETQHEHECKRDAVGGADQGTNDPLAADP